MKTRSFLKIKKLISIGDNSGDLFEDRRVFIANIISIMALCITFTYNIVYASYGFWNPFLLNILVFSSYLSVIKFNHLKKYKQARIVLSYTALIQLSIIPWVFIGKDSGIHFYLIGVSMMSLLLFPVREKNITFSLFSLAISLFIFIEYGNWTSPFLVDCPDYLSKIFHFMSTTGITFMIAVVVITFYVNLNNAQKSLEIEREKSDKLLLNILPLSVANQLKEKETIIADEFKQTTILFADIVGFTSFSEKTSPTELVSILNEIFSLFDNLVEKHKLEKIKTIGDAYMVAGGIPSPMSNDVDAVADLALEMRGELKKFNRENNQTFSVRIGIHTGQVVAGVIGIKKFIYDVWGDTVNTASRMESHGIPEKIQVSEQVYRWLKDKYIFQERGVIHVKGKGNMRTYFLQGKH